MTETFSLWALAYVIAWQIFGFVEHFAQELFTKVLKVTEQGISQEMISTTLSFLLFNATCY